MSFHIDGKVALITGANRGIGRAIVDSFLQHGVAKVYAAVRNLDTVIPLTEIYGDRIVPIPIDLSDSEAIAQAAQIATDVELVVNSAGILCNATPLSENAIASLQAEIEINVFGLIRMAQAFAPVLKANGGGAFVQINSIASIKSFVNFSTYSASKAAAYSITQALRAELAQQGTLVISVHPGPILTDMAQQTGLAEIAQPASVVSEGIILALKDEKFHLFPDTMAQQIGEVYVPFAVNIVEAD